VLRFTAARQRLISTRGAIDLASIMVGVLVIGIIGGVIAAMVFAVIPWSQDSAAKQTLSAVRDAESVWYPQSAEENAESTTSLIAMSEPLSRKLAIVSTSRTR
jgi:hypothetical protein